MNFMDLALNNVKKNGKNYLLFVFSQIVTTFIFYNFVSLILNQKVQEAIENGLIFYISLSISSVVLLIFVVIFNGYMASLMNQKRKKEIGIYTLIGIEKRKIGHLLALETFILGVVSLFVGIFLGVLSSKFFIGMFLKVTRIQMENHFFISWKGIALTSSLFIILILLNMISNYRIVYKYSLITLLKAAKKNQKLGTESGVLGIIGLLFSSIAYIQLLAPNTSFNVIKKIGIDASSAIGSFVVAILLILGTYLTIGTLLPYSIKKLTNNKKIYYNNNNMIALANIRFNLNSQINLMSLVTLLVTITLLALAFSSTLYVSVTQTSEKLIPVSYQLTNSSPEITRKLLTSISPNKIGFIKDVKTLSNTSEDGLEYLPASENKALLKAEHQTLLDELLEVNEVNMIISNEQTTQKELSTIFEHAISKKQLGSDTIKEFSNIKPFNPKQTLVIIPDEVVTKTDNFFENKYTLIDLKENEDSIKLAKELTKIVEDAKAENKNANVYLTSSVLVNYDASTSGGLFLFVSLFVSMIFIVATGSILYFKQSNEAYSQMSQFDLMIKLGIDSTQLKTIIAKQIRIIFFVPLYIGIIHCVLLLLAEHLSSGTNIRHYWPLLAVIVSYTIIFQGYYQLTLKRYQKIVHIVK